VHEPNSRLAALMWRRQGEFVDHILPYTGLSFEVADSLVLTLLVANRVHALRRWQVAQRALTSGRAPSKGWLQIAQALSNPERGAPMPLDQPCSQLPLNWTRTPRLGGDTVAQKSLTWWPNSPRTQ